MQLRDEFDRVVGLNHGGSEAVALPRSAMEETGTALQPHVG